MAVNSGEDCQGAHDVSVISDGGRNIPEWKSPSFSEAPSLNSLQKTYDAPLKCQYLGCVKVNDLDIHNLSNLDLDIEEGRLEIPKANENTFGVSKSEDSWTSKISLHGGGRFMHLLTNNGLELPKFMSRDKSMTERIFDTPTSRSRKYKRSASFNSRRVVLIFLSPVKSGNSDTDIADIETIKRWICQFLNYISMHFYFGLLYQCKMCCLFCCLFYR